MRCAGGVAGGVRELQHTHLLTAVIQTPDASGAVIRGSQYLFVLLDGGRGGDGLSLPPSLPPCACVPHLVVKLQ